MRRWLRGRVAVARGTWQTLPPNLRGALWVLLAAVFFSSMGALIKALGDRLDSFQIAFFRSLFGLFAILPFVIRGRWHAFYTRRMGMHFGRAALGVVAMFCGFYALTHMALADVVAISFTRPLFLIVLAVLLLGEGVKPKRWLATAVGFIGVLIIVQPGGETFESVALIALFGALLVAFIKVLVKKLSATESSPTILLYFGLFASLLALGPALLVWRDPTWLELGLLFMVGAVGAIAQVCTIRALRIAEATAVMPFDYARLLFAGLIGLVVFGEVPGWWSLLGALVIVASTFAVARLEARDYKAESGAREARATTISTTPSDTKTTTERGLRKRPYQDGATPSATARTSSMNTPK